MNFKVYSLNAQNLVAVQQANAEKLAQFENAITQAQQAMGYANTQQGLQVQAGTAAQKKH